MAKEYSRKSIIIVMIAVLALVFSGVFLSSCGEAEKPAKTEEKAAEPVKEAPVEKKEPEPVKVIPKDYHVVAGCFKIETNATNYEVALKKEGYDAKYIGEWKGYYTVVYGSFESKADALKEYKVISQDKGKPAWILHYKL